MSARTAIFLDVAHLDDCCKQTETCGTVSRSYSLSLAALSVYVSSVRISPRPPLQLSRAAVTLNKRTRPSVSHARHLPRYRFRNPLGRELTSQTLCYRLSVRRSNPNSRASAPPRSVLSTLEAAEAKQLVPSRAQSPLFAPSQL